MESTYGEVITSLPDGFVPREQWPEYLLTSTPPPIFKPKEVGVNPRGMRWSLWPLTFEEYITDLEPDLSVSDPERHARNRIVLWRRLTRTDVPKGWYRFSSRPSRLEGFAEVRGEYWRTWSESARRYRKKWLAEYLNKKYILKKISFEEFAKSYDASTVVQKAGHLMLNIAKRKVADSDTEETIECWGARRMSDGMLMAGMLFNHSVSCKGSYYLCGFYRSEAADEPLMVALVDQWFALAQERGIRFLHFGGFWQKGNPRNWKGFSLFKAKFGLFYVAYPPVLIQFLRGKFF